ncbi:hypothetical protein [Streptomyces sp. NPDC059247]|uniref:hypothetical protein n=1 Tax=Streptomyces sp. NPDC059247 TaxID=3346790 RepID=UPI00367B1329
MRIFPRRAFAGATAVLASAGAATADSVGNNLPGLRLLSKSFGNGEQPDEATGTLPTHNALNNITLP